MIRLSIIIPFYNVEKYIAQCLDSVYNQDIPEEDYEVICVNDASPDHSRDIVLGYQRKHPNLILVEHEVNRKLGAARNTGRRIARGNYIWNVDSDDWLAPNCLKEILSRCEMNELDVMIMGFMENRRDGEMKRKECVWNEMRVILSGLDFWKHYMVTNPGENSQVWTKIYRRSYLDEKGIFSPEINFGEDVPFNVESILRAGRLMTYNEVCYYHHCNTDSMTSELKQTSGADKVFENCFTCSYYVDRVRRKIQRDKEVQQSLLYLERWMILVYCRYVREMSDASVKELRRLCRRHFMRDLFVFGVLSRKSRFQYLGFVLNL